MNFKREIEIKPARDLRGKDEGAHGCEINFLLRGKKGVVLFVIGTNWHLSHVAEEFLVKPIKDTLDVRDRFFPFPIDICYHSLIPLYSGQKISSKRCPYLNGNPCYYGKSISSAEPVFTCLLEGGSEALWKELEKYYDLFFRNNNKQ